MLSDVEIPELPPLRDLRNSGSARVSLRILGPRREVAEPAQWLNETIYADGTPWLSIGKIDGGYLLRFPQLADFVVDSAGHEVVCAATAEDVSVVTLRHLAIDHVMPRVLNLLGIESLHATAVAVGPAGARLSAKLAPANRRSRRASISPGCTRFATIAWSSREDGKRIIATPAYPGVRLWDDSFEALDDRCGSRFAGRSIHRQIAAAGRDRDLSRRFVAARANLLSAPSGRRKCGGDDARRSRRFRRPKHFRCWSARVIRSISPTRRCSGGISNSSCASPPMCRCAGC